ncbi:NepR family anti-sigma factor [Novosphingobium lubricantis]|jgi:hypothetical protein
MSKEKNMIAGQSRRESEKSSQPDWADGLKSLYNAVVEEPLPDSFAQLLAKLDSPSHD